MFVMESFPSYRYCGRPIEKDERCVFHVPKPSIEELKTLNPEERKQANQISDEFCSKFKTLLEEYESNPKILVCEFTGFQFPYLVLSHLGESRTFPKKVTFRGATLEWVYFDHAVFKEDVDFSNAVFRFVAQFGATVFEGLANFSEATFHAWADFAGAKFASTSFLHASFAQDATFEGAEFQNVSDFSGATIQGQGRFSYAVFREKTSFWWTKFDKRVSFLLTTFEGRSEFRWTVFGGDAEFWGTTFRETVDFLNSSFREAASFEGRENGCFLAECNFRGVTLVKERQIVFDNVDLARTSFIDTDIEQISFRQVGWSHHKSRWKRWRVLWDEVKPLENEKEREYGRIAENYRQLVLNYERKRGFNAAEDFHVGEMEMRRIADWVWVESSVVRYLRKWLNAYNLYKVSNNYGTSYNRGLAVLLFLILTFSTLFFVSGFKTFDKPNEPSRVIEYDLLVDQGHQRVSLQQWLNDYESAMSLSLSIMTFQKDRFYEPLEGWSRLWLYLAVIILTSQEAMVLLSIRRRFRR